MKKTFFILAASALIAASCDKNGATSSNGKETADVIPVSVSVKTRATKALAASDAEDMVNTLHLFLYRVDNNGDKIFESYYDFSSSTQGGTIYIDVNDDGSVCGVQNLDESLKKIADILENQIRIWCIRMRCTGL